MFDSHKIDAYFNGDQPFDNIRPDDKPKTSFWLRFVKLGFPCVAAGILGVMVVMPNIKKSVELQNNVTMPRKNEMEKLHIEETVYHATDAKNRVSTVTADSVDEVAPGSKEVKINNPRGEIPTDSGLIHIKSEVGFFDQGNNILTLSGKVIVNDEKETLIQTEKASYDFKKEYGYGNERVDADGDWGDLEAQGFEYFKTENILVLKGKHVVTTKQGILTADGETRYFQNEQRSVSTGNVIVRQEDNILYADKVIAYYTEKNELKKAEAFGNVRIITPKGKAYGERSVYNPLTSKVELFDNVRLEQDGNVINGNHAETDLKTQISRLTGNKQKGGRISGTFYNKRKAKDASKSDK